MGTEIKKKQQKPELLIPASSLEVLKTAVVFGADAVYIGGEAFGLRAKARNFSIEEMARGILFAHARGVKVYVTANILAHNEDLPGVEAYSGPQCRPGGGFTVFCRTAGYEAGTL